MKTTLLIALGLVAAAFLAGSPVAAAEPGPCGPDVQNCQPFEPCRRPSNPAVALVCGADRLVPEGP